ncbi:hypothetical protein MHYP_G00361880 [Metynnis hypsauchen]
MDLYVSWRRKRTTIGPVTIMGQNELVDTYKYLDNKLDWRANTAAVYRKGAHSVLKHLLENNTQDGGAVVTQQPLPVRQMLLFVFCHKYMETAMASVYQLTRACLQLRVLNVARQRRLGRSCHKCCVRRRKLGKRAGFYTYSPMFALH